MFVVFIHRDALLLKTPLLFRFIRIESIIFFRFASFVIRGFRSRLNNFSENTLFQRCVMSTVLIFSVSLCSILNRCQYHFFFIQNFYWLRTNLSAILHTWPILMTQILKILFCRFVRFLKKEKYWRSISDWFFSEKITVDQKIGQNRIEKNEKKLIFRISKVFRCIVEIIIFKHHSIYIINFCF